MERNGSFLSQGSIKLSTVVKQFWKFTYRGHIYLHNILTWKISCVKSSPTSNAERIQQLLLLCIQPQSTVSDSYSFIHSHLIYHQQPYIKINPFISLQIIINLIFYNYTIFQAQLNFHILSSKSEGKTTTTNQQCIKRDLRV